MMKIIDSHAHLDLRKLGDAKGFFDEAKKNDIDFSMNGFLKELDKNNIEKVVVMSGIATESFSEELKYLLTLAENKRFICVSYLIPSKELKNSIKIVKDAIHSGLIKGLKVLPGYFPFYPTDKVFHPFYKLAADCGIPVMIHTGDVHMKLRKLKYAHPLIVDDLAVDFPNTKFIMAHIGNPWTLDCAEIVYKNDNVFCDLSGIVIGRFDKEMETVKHSAERVKNAIFYAEDFSKILYGSDWPLVNMNEYIEFVKSCVPNKHWENIFYNNAKKIFNV